jgi:N-acetylmuramoyl-L-alanine amidase
MKAKYILYGIIVASMMVVLLLSFNKDDNSSMPAVKADHKQNPLTVSVLADKKAETTTKQSIVIIDAGHGGKDPGAGKGELSEKNITLDLSLLLKKELDERGITCYLTRDNDKFISLSQRVKTANEHSADLFISIHNNSYKTASKGGILTIYSPKSKSGKDIAKLMHSEIIDSGMLDKEIEARKYLYVLNYTDMPSLLLEVGFLSNKGDLALLQDQTFKSNIIKKVANGVEKILQAHYY